MLKNQPKYDDWIGKIMGPILDQQLFGQGVLTLYTEYITITLKTYKPIQNF